LFAAVTAPAFASLLAAGELICRLPAVTTMAENPDTASAALTMFMTAGFRDVNYTSNGMRRCFATCRASCGLGPRISCSPGR
jgi:hypothetical protein